MPNPKPTGHAFSIQNFIVEAETIHNGVSPYSTFALAEPHLYVQYKQWNLTVRSFFTENHLDHYLPKDFFLGEHIEAPRRQLGANIFDDKYTQDSKQFRREWSDAITSQINTLKEVQKQLETNEKPLAIYLEKDGALWRDPRSQYKHKSSKDSKRLKFILLLSKIDGFVGTRTVMEKISYGNESNLSKEKGRINALLREKLDLAGDLIEGERLRGYRINPSYRVVRR